jgi:hypothetical protein
MRRKPDAIPERQIANAVAKWLGGIAPKRKMPAFAVKTFKAWFFRREPRTYKLSSGGRAQ